MIPQGTLQLSEIHGVVQGQVHVHGGPVLRGLTIYLLLVFFAVSQELSGNNWTMIIIVQPIKVACLSRCFGFAVYSS